MRRCQQFPTKIFRIGLFSHIADHPTVERIPLMLITTVLPILLIFVLCFRHFCLTAISVSQPFLSHSHFCLTAISVSQPYLLKSIGSTKNKLFTVTTGLEVPFYPILSFYSIRLGLKWSLSFSFTFHLRFLG
jgi:hypothetical protein